MIEDGIADLDAGRVIGQEEVEKRFSELRAKSYEAV